MSAHSNNGLITLSKLLITLILGSLLFSACRKDHFSPRIAAEAKAPCILQSDNPAGRSYAADSVIEFNCAQSFCGLLPLNSKNYWIYEDSIFMDGVFSKVQFDTLRFSSNFKTLEDGLVWWKTSLDVGLPDILYANDSALFDMNERLFTPGIMDVKKDYSLFYGDSVKYLASFEDNAAMGRSLKLQTAVTTPYGSFENCIYFEKNARNYRKDQVFFSPGLGVVKYIMEKAAPGTREIKLQKVSTLVSFYFE